MLYGHFEGEWNFGQFFYFCATFSPGQYIQDKPIAEWQRQNT
jgi:hypothetical protein